MKTFTAFVTNTVVKFPVAPTKLQTNKIRRHFCEVVLYKTHISVETFRPRLNYSFQNIVISSKAVSIKTCSAIGINLFIPVFYDTSLNKSFFFFFTITSDVPSENAYTKFIHATFCVSYFQNVLNTRRCNLNLVVKHHFYTRLYSSRPNQIALYITYIWTIGLLRLPWSLVRRSPRADVGVSSLNRTRDTSPDADAQTTVKEGHITKVQDFAATPFLNVRETREIGSVDRIRFTGRALHNIGLPSAKPRGMWGRRSRIELRSYEINSRRDSSRRSYWKGRTRQRRH